MYMYKSFSFFFMSSHFYIGGRFSCFYQVIFQSLFNPIALRKTKIAYNFGLSECSSANVWNVFKSICFDFVIVKFIWNDAFFIYINDTRDENYVRPLLSCATSRQ